MPWKSAQFTYGTYNVFFSLETDGCDFAIDFYDRINDIHFVDYTQTFNTKGIHNILFTKPDTDTQIEIRLRNNNDVATTVCGIILTNVSS